MAALTQPAGGKISLFWPMHVRADEQHRLRARPADQPRAVLQDCAQADHRDRDRALLSGLLRANTVVGYVGGLYSSLPTTTFWLIHVASAAFGLVAFAIFKVVLGKRMESTPQDQAAALS